MNQTIVDRLLPLVEAYALGRRHQKDLRRQMRGRRCTDNRDGVGCFEAGGDPEIDWCENCLKREPIWQQFIYRRRMNKALLRRLEALGLKLSLPDVPAEPEPVKELLELMERENGKEEIAAQG